MSITESSNFCLLSSPNIVNRDDPEVQTYQGGLWQQCCHFPLATGELFTILKVGRPKIYQDINGGFIFRFSLGTF